MKSFPSNGITKRCATCLLELPNERFHKAKSPDGLRFDCKSCRTIRTREIRVPYNSLSPDKQRHILETNRAARLRSAEKHLLKNAKRRSKLCNVPFDIGVEDIIIPEFCPVLGMKLEFNRTLAGYNSPSLDRIVTTKGYVKGNVHVISWRANKIKTDATLEELEMLLSYLKKL